MKAIVDTFSFDGTAIWVVVFSVGMFLGSIVLAWVFIVKMPADYLTNDHPYQRFRSHHPVARLIILVCRNLFGLLMVVCGIIMLFIPGQGILFIFLGLTLLDFPGKKRLIRRMLSRRKTLDVINRIRAKANQQPLESLVQ
jgi:hypothetical protein